MGLKHRIADPSTRYQDSNLSIQIYLHPQDVRLCLFVKRNSSQLSYLTFVKHWKARNSININSVCVLEEVPSAQYIWKFTSVPICISRRYLAGFGRRYPEIRSFMMTDRNETLCGSFSVVSTSNPDDTVNRSYLGEMVRARKIYERRAFQFSLFQFWKIDALEKTESARSKKTPISKQPVTN